jgi:hypothetical protein
MYHYSGICTTSLCWSQNNKASVYLLLSDLPLVPLLTKPKSKPIGEQTQGNKFVTPLLGSIEKNTKAQDERQ